MAAATILKPPFWWSCMVSELLFLSIALVAQISVAIHSPRYKVTQFDRSLWKKAVHAERNCLPTLDTIKIQRYNNSPPCVIAKWREGQIPPFDFLGFSRNYLHLVSAPWDQSYSPYQQMLLESFCNKHKQFWRLTMCIATCMHYASSVITTLTLINALSPFSPQKPLFFVKIFFIKQNHLFFTRIFLWDTMRNLFNPKKHYHKPS